MGERSESSPFALASLSGDDILESEDMTDLLKFGDAPDEGSIAEAAPSFQKDSSKPEEDFNSKKRGIDRVEPRAKKPRPRTKSRKKKPPGIPKRPLCAYNYFFQQERMKLQGNSTPKIGFRELGKIVGRRWKGLSDEDRKQYAKLAREDSTRYRNEMEAYKIKEKRKADEDSSSAPEPESSPEPWSLPFPPTADGAPIARLAGPQSFPVSSFAQIGPSQGEEAFWNQRRGVLPAPGRSDMFGPQQLNRQCFAVPPGLEIFLPDSNGSEQKFTVKYTMVSMTREDAERYMASLMPTLSSIVQGGRQPVAPNPQQQGPMQDQRLPTQQPPTRAAMEPPMQPPDRHQYSYTGRYDAPQR